MLLNPKSSSIKLLTIKIVDIWLGHERKNWLPIDFTHANTRKKFKEFMAENPNPFTVFEDGLRHLVSQTAWTCLNEPRHVLELIANGKMTVYAQKFRATLKTDSVARTAYLIENPNIASDEAWSAANALQTGLGVSIPPSNLEALEAGVLERKSY